MTVPLAFIMPSWQEMMILLVIGLLLFGRRLPEVGKQIGRTVIHFRKGLQDFKDEINSDGSLTDARAAVDDLRRTVTAPQRMRDPRQVFEALTDESRSSTPSGDTSEAADELPPFPEDLPDPGNGDEPDREREPG